MNNLTVQQDLQDCEDELLRVEAIIIGLGVASHISPYLTKYAIIRACGAIERAFKGLITDYCNHRSKPQVKRFLNRRVREGSANPSFDVICRFLKDFDPSWQAGFKTRVDASPNKAALMTSLQSLVDARNDFAHGGDPGSSIGDILSYFRHAREIIDKMDDVIC